MILTLDVGATNIKVALFDRKTKKIVRQIIVPTNAMLGHQGVLNALNAAISPFATVAQAVAIASAGDVDANSGIVTFATDNLPGMTGFNYPQFVWENYCLPAVAINDAHAALLGEVNFGVGNVGKRIVMLTLGSGVGGGYCVDGKICSTRENDFARFGHICLEQNGRHCNCGKDGCVECYLSGRALHKDAAMCGMDSDDLFAKFAQNSAPHVQFVQNFRNNFQLALGKINEISPFDVCIVGGGVVDWIGDNFNAVFDGMNKKVIRAALGNLAGVYGALAHLENKGVLQ